MTNKQRLDLIEKYIREHKYADLHTLADKFGISLYTVRRALNELEAANIICRHHGGASLVEEDNGSSGYDFITQDNRQTEQKHAIARTMADLIEPGMTVMLDGGTTTYTVARALVEKRLVVITNSLPIAALFGDALADAVDDLRGQPLDLLIGERMIPAPVLATRAAGIECAEKAVAQMRLGTLAGLRVVVADILSAEITQKRLPCLQRGRVHIETALDHHRCGGALVVIDECVVGIIEPLDAWVQRFPFARDRVAAQAGKEISVPEGLVELVADVLVLQSHKRVGVGVPKGIGRVPDAKAHRRML